MSLYHCWDPYVSHPQRRCANSDESMDARKQLMLRLKTATATTNRLRKRIQRTLQNSRPAQCGGPAPVDASVHKPARQETAPTYNLVVHERSDIAISHSQTCYSRLAHCTCARGRRCVTSSIRSTRPWRRPNPTYASHPFTSREHQSRGPKPGHPCHPNPTKTIWLQYQSSIP